MMFHETIRNDDFSSTKRCNIVASYNIATLCCTKNRRCESSRLRSPLEQETTELKFDFKIIP